VSKLEVKIEMLKFDIEQRDEQIQSCIRKIQAFHNNVCNKLNEVIKVNKDNSKSNLYIPEDCCLLECTPV
jgi:hypothetical protein